MTLFATIQNAPPRFGWRTVLALAMGLAWLAIVAATGPALAQRRPVHGQTTAALLQNIPPKVLDRGSTRLDLTALIRAYPGFIRRVTVDGQRRLWVVMADGTQLAYDDGHYKTFDQRLAGPDLQDMLAQVYRPGPIEHRIPADFDPGRFRPMKFFRAVYGANPRQVRANLVPVRFLGRIWRFNRRNGAARALGRVGRDLAALLKRRPDLRRFTRPQAGTFAWRKIAGTNRLSPHAFGIAIDLNPKLGGYWRWMRGLSPGRLLRMRRDYPIEIVAIFERHGFIWGGKWYHFDLMHFEYRPEMILRHGLSATPDNPR